MDLFPAIDVRGGRCVRLYQGDYGRETVYDDDPAGVARRFLDAGGRWLHVVDLDAALTGTPVNRSVVEAVTGAVHPAMRVQVGGGVRDAATADALVRAGVSRIVVGTAAVENPALVAELAGHVPVAVGLDVRGDEVAVRGWTEASGLRLTDLLPGFEEAGVEAVVVTQIARDGTLEGPDLDGVASVLAATALDVVASGGVGTLDDLRALDAIDVGGRRLAGVIVGRALYEGRFTVEEALAVCGGEAADR